MWYHTKSQENDKVSKNDDDDDDMYLLTLLTIYMIQINQNIYNNYNHIERVRTSGIGLRPSGLKWKKSKKVSSIN